MYSWFGKISVVESTVETELRNTTQMCRRVCCVYSDVFCVL